MPSCWPPPNAVAPVPTRSSAPWCSTPQGPSSARARTPADRATRTRRSSPSQQPASAPEAAPSSARSSRATTGGVPDPCSQALIAAGVARLVYGVDDPNPAAAGGARTLRSAGVDVESGVLAEDCERVNEVWLLAVRTGRPFVTWKYAATLDGRSAAADGTSRWITSPESRADVHRLRAEADAVVAGVGTVLADDPRLTVRTDNLDQRQPLRVVLDSDGRTPHDSEGPRRGRTGRGRRRLPRPAGPAPRCWSCPAVLTAGSTWPRRSRPWTPAGCVTCSWRAARPWPGPSCRPAWSTGSSPTSRPSLLGAGSAALVDPTVTTLAQAHRLRFDEHRNHRS